MDEVDRLPPVEGAWKGDGPAASGKGSSIGFDAGNGGEEACHVSA
jgi:hypothetical protein